MFRIVKARENREEEGQHLGPVATPLFLVLYLFQNLLEASIL